MAFQKADGTPLNKTELTALTQAQPAPRVFTEDIYETITFPGMGNKFESSRRLKFNEGHLIQQSQIDDLFPAASVTAVSPATGPAAGGTVVTITGANLGGATSVTFGGTAGTAFKVNHQGSITVTTPAKTAGAQAVVVVDDSGNVAAGNFTYV